MLLWELLPVVLPDVLMLTLLFTVRQGLAQNPGKALLFRPYNKLSPPEKEHYSLERLRLAEKIIAGACVLLVVAKDAAFLCQWANGLEPAAAYAAAVDGITNAGIVLLVVLLACMLAKFPLALFRKRQGE